jgi:hypothetical protein
VFPAAEALDAGLVRSVHPPDELLPAAYELAHEIADNTSAVSVALTRQMLWRMLGESHPMAAHQVDSQGIDAMGKSADAREGVVAFLQKRTIACFVVAPARKAAVGRFGLRYTRGGFGTPFFGANHQVRVDGASLVVQDRDDERVAPISSVAAAAALAGVALDDDPGVGSDIPPLDNPDVPLAIDPASAAALGEWYGFAASVLEEVRWQRRAHGTVSRVQLWPEHFDLAFDHGADRPGAVRANLGASPGDAAHPEPYLYAGPWEHQDGDFWNESFGASLSYAALLAADDQRAAALDFFGTALDLLG